MFVDYCSGRCTAREPTEAYWPRNIWRQWLLSSHIARVHSTQEQLRSCYTYKVSNRVVGVLLDMYAIISASHHLIFSVYTIDFVWYVFPFVVSKYLLQVLLFFAYLDGDFCRQWLEIQQYRKRAKKVVDRKASKGRKTRQVSIADSCRTNVKIVLSLNECNGYVLGWCEVRFVAANLLQPSSSLWWKSRVICCWYLLLDTKAVA